MEFSCSGLLLRFRSFCLCMTAKQLAACVLVSISKVKNCEREDYALCVGEIYLEMSYKWSVSFKIYDVFVM